MVDPGAVAGSADVGILATAAGAAIVFWLLGGADPSLFAETKGVETIMLAVPSNHSPRYAPVIEPTLSLGRQDPRHGRAGLATAHRRSPAGEIARAFNPRRRRRGARPTSRDGGRLL